MQIVEIRERPVHLPRYDPTEAGSCASTSLVAVVTDQVLAGERIIGFGYGSVGRYAQSGLIRERFAPRLLEASPEAYLSPTGSVDPQLAWAVMMAGEKTGGHGERCVAVGALDMAMWDIAAKVAGLPLHALIAQRFSPDQAHPATIPVYASGGYLHPHNDLSKLTDEVKHFLDLGFDRIKIKIGSTDAATDLKRVDTVARLVDGRARLAVDAMNAYDRRTAMQVSAALDDLDLWWLEDLCDPHDFQIQVAVARTCVTPLAAGEALFSTAEAVLLAPHGCLRSTMDYLVFDPAHCYGLTEYVRLVTAMHDRGWPHLAFWPHGGHLFGAHVAAGLGLGGAEITPIAFSPFSMYRPGPLEHVGRVVPPDIPGIGFERVKGINELIRRELRTS